MKRQIFIVDDKIKDVRGFLLILYAVLSDHFDDEKEMEARFEEIELFYIDILWENRPEVFKDRKEYFDKSCAYVKEHVNKGNVPSFSMNYLHVCLSEENYRDQANRSEMAKQVYDVIEEKRQEGYPYAILLDIILNLNVDTGEIHNRADILSSLLFREKINEKNCIVYSTYEDFLFDDWINLVKNTPNCTLTCVRREWICRGRTIDLKYQKWLLNALELVKDGDDQTDG